MKLIILGLIGLVAICGVESGKIKICLPKKKKLNKVSADLSFDETFKTINELPKEITIPLTIPFKLSNEVIKATGYATNVSISNYSNFTLCLFPSLTEPLNITLNTLTISADDHNITGEVGDLFDIYGNGSFEMDFEAMSFAINHLFPTIPLGCVGVDLNIALRSLKANFPNLMNGDDLLNPLFNKVIGDLGPDALDYFWPPIYKVLAKYINYFLDKYVNHYELENFVGAYFKGKDQKKRCYNFPE